MPLGSAPMQLVCSAPTRLDALGLSPVIVRNYAAKKRITELFPWQARALS